MLDTDYRLGVRLDTGSFLYPLLANQQPPSFLGARSDRCPTLGRNAHTVFPWTDEPLRGSC